MKIHEYQAKALFRSYGIPAPADQLATTPEDVRKAAEHFGTVVAVKAQVHVGGRGKAGGIKVVKNADEAFEAGQRILGMDIKGITVKKVSVVESSAEIEKEAYLGIILDRAIKGITFICSAEGGVDIEEVAATMPDKIITFSSTSRDFPEDEARAVAGQLFNDETKADAVLNIMRGLFKLFVEKDCSLAEINPLVVNSRGDVVALDGKINFDDNALFRQPDILALRDMDEEDPNEIEAKEKGLSFIQLDGEIGCMVNGAGLAMATMDMIKFYGGEPANFLDVGGSSSPEKVIHAFKLLMSNPKIKAILINIFGGITRCDDIARGILESFKHIDIQLPVVIRLSGTNAEEGMALLEGAPLVTADTFGNAVQTAIRLANGEAA
jgi:succinyl-CoA synthetase beta subunit